MEITSSAPNTSGLKLVNLTAVNATAYTGILAHDASGNVISVAGSSLATVTVSNTAPSSPVVGQQWLDTSLTPSELKVWNGTTWELVNDEVQHYADFASFPATGDEDVVYIADATDTAYVWDSTTSAYVSITGATGWLFSITDGATTESIWVGQTVTFNEAATAASVLNLKVSATDTVTLEAVAGHTSGQAIVSDGTNLVYGNPIAKRFANTYTPVANTAFTVAHSLNVADPIVQVRDATTNEVVTVDIVIVDANNITITSTTTDTLRVTVL